MTAAMLRCLMCFIIVSPKRKVMNYRTCVMRHADVSEKV